MFCRLYSVEYRIFHEIFIFVPILKNIYKFQNIFGPFELFIYLYFMIF